MPTYGHVPCASARLPAAVSHETDALADTALFEMELTVIPEEQDHVAETVACANDGRIVGRIELEMAEVIQADGKVTVLTTQGICSI